MVGSTLNKYTNSGTVSIDPPPPISPSDKPISIDAMYPIISKMYRVVKLFVKNVLKYDSYQLLNGKKR